MNTTIDVHAAGTVGGRIQMVAITPTKYRVKEGGGDLDAQPNVNIVTAGPDDVRGFTHRDNRRKDYTPLGATLGDFDV